MDPTSFIDSKNHSNTALGAFQGLESEGLSPELKRKGSGKELSQPSSAEIYEINHLTAKIETIRSETLKKYEELNADFISSLRKLSNQTLNAEEYEKLKGIQDKLNLLASQLLFAHAEGPTKQKAFKSLFALKSSSISIFLPGENKEKGAINKRVDKFFNKKGLILDLQKPFKAIKQSLKNWLPNLPKDFPNDFDPLAKELDVLYKYKDMLCYIAAILQTRINLTDQSYLATINSLEQSLIKNLLLELEAVINKEFRNLKQTPEKTIPEIYLEISNSLQAYYIEKILNEKINQKIEQLIKKYESSQKSKKLTFFYPSLTKKIAENIRSLDLPDPIAEWMRVIDGGTLIFLNEKGGVEIEPFKKIDGEKAEDKEQRLQMYVALCLKVCSQKLFGDETLMANLHRAFQNTSEYTKDKEILQIQAQNFKTFLDLKFTPSEDSQKLLNAVTEELKKLNPKTDAWDRFESTSLVMSLMDYNRLFYIVASQTLIWGAATGSVYAAYRQAFPDDRVIENLQDWDDQQTKKVQVTFHPDNLEFKFLRLTGFAHNPDKCQLLQDLTIRFPLPGKDDSTLKEAPVSIQFYYKYSEDLDNNNEFSQEKLAIENYLQRFSSVLKALTFPPLKKWKPN